MIKKYFLGIIVIFCAPVFAADNFNRIAIWLALVAPPVELLPNLRVHTRQPAPMQQQRPQRYETLRKNQPCVSKKRY